MCKKLISVLLCLSMLIIMASPILASSDITNKPVDVLNLWEEGINTKNLDLYLSTYSENSKNEMNQILSNVTEDQKQFIEFYSIDKLVLKNLKRLSPSDVKDLLNLEPYNGKTFEIYYFYVDTKLKGSENRYNINGENFRICILIKENGSWKIAQMSVAPVPFLLLKNINLNSNKESKIEGDINSIHQNIEKDEKSINKEQDFSNAVTTYALSSIVQPNTIRVYIGMYENWHNRLGLSTPIVESVDFTSYVMDVLPNEWDSDIVVPDCNNYSTKKWQSLYCGALMVKTYGWYNVVYPVNPGVGFDVYDDTRSQYYLIDSKNKISQDGNGVSFDWGDMCEYAVYYVINQVIWNGSSNQPYFASYNQTTQSNTYSWSSQGKTYSQMVNLTYGSNATVRSY